MNIPTWIYRETFRKKHGLAPVYPPEISLMWSHVLDGVFLRLRQAPEQTFSLNSGLIGDSLLCSPPSSPCLLLHLCSNMHEASDDTR